MVYHMKNWKFARDMMCSNPKSVVGDIVGILEEMGVSLPEKNREEIDRIVRDCSCVETQEGLESCFNLSREDMTPKWSGKPGENLEFETFLQKLDENMKGMIEDFFEKHVL